MNSVLKTYLLEAGIDEGEMAHSFRSGCDVTLALLRSAIEDSMSHVGWELSHKANYYMQPEKVLRHDNASALQAEADDDHDTSSDLARLYQNPNSVKDSVQAFATDRRKP